MKIRNRLLLKFLGSFTILSFVVALFWKENNNFVFTVAVIVTVLFLLLFLGFLLKNFSFIRKIKEENINKYATVKGRELFDYHATVTKEKEWDYQP